jgi:putative DNA primase/helicase
MKIDSEKLISETDIVEVISKYITLTKRGSEFYGNCPFHDDHKASLQVNTNKKIFKCFACGVGGDVIEFVTRQGNSFHEAVQIISGNAESIPKVHDVAQLTPAPKRQGEWKQVKPSTGVGFAIQHGRHGLPSKTWTYKDRDGGVIGYVCRFDTPNGKEVLPFVYATDGNRSEWRWLGFEKPRPLYNLDLITQHQTALVVLVEGEKTADAIQHHFDPSEVIATTWIGGANSIGNADFTPIEGRTVNLWADNDEPGRKAMLEVAKHLKGAVRWIPVPDTYPEKWDAADKEWTQSELLQFISRHTNLPFEQKITSPPQPPKNPPLPPVVKEVELYANNPHYRMLGYDKDENSRLVYYFFSFDAKAVIKLSPSSINKANLMMLAPLTYWENEFPGAGKNRFDADSATQYLMLNSHKVGTFKDKFIRGRGAWIDNSKIVIHTGDSLIVDKQIVPLSAMKSRYVYEINERLGFGTSQPLNTKESAKLIEKAKWLLWDREINAYLLAGWCVIAPFCGVLSWRPHIWVTGPAGSGKSWVMDNFVKRLLGDTAVVVQGKTTEAGVRGLLQNDARAVLFDESDVDSHNDKERVQNILSLARSASYHDGGVIGKGTQSGASRTYTMRSCFAFSSIGVHVNQQSDRSRFTTLGLQSFEGKRSKDEFAPFEHDWNTTVTDEFVKALQSRTTEMLPTILKNARVFADAVAAVIGQRRIGDQVGAMLAGAYSLTSTKAITYEDAVKWVSMRDWAEERGLELTKDEYQLFGKIMSHIITLETDSGRIDRSVGEIILVAIGKRAEFGTGPDSAHARLRRLGIMIKDDRILIANQANGIINIIKDTSWSSNYNQVLYRIPGADKVEPRAFFPGMKSRSVSLPLSMVTDALEEFKDDPRVMLKNSWNKTIADEDMPF